MPDWRMWVSILKKYVYYMFCIQYFQLEMDTRGKWSKITTKQNLKQDTNISKRQKKNENEKKPTTTIHI